MLISNAPVSFALNMLHTLQWHEAVVIDRFQGLSRPDGSFLSFKRSVQVLVFVWFAICGISAPVIAFTDTAVDYDAKRIPRPIVRCVTMLYMSPRARLIYWLSGRVLVFFVPLIITCMSNAGIYWKMRRAQFKVLLKYK
jgi:hypothetical protein